MTTACYQLGIQCNTHSVSKKRKAMQVRSSSAGRSYSFIQKSVIVLKCGTYTVVTQLHKQAASFRPHTGV